MSTRLVVCLMRTLLLFLFWSTTVQANQVDIELSERSDANWTVTRYVLDTQRGVLRHASEAFGDKIPPISRYHVTAGDSPPYQLLADNKVIGSAVGILYQCRSGDADVVIVHNEYNTFLGPLKLLAALSGHPMQVNEVVVYVIQDERVTARLRIAKRINSFDFRAEVRE